MNRSKAEEQSKLEAAKPMDKLNTPFEKLGYIVRADGTVEVKVRS